MPAHEVLVSHYGAAGGRDRRLRQIEGLRDDFLARMPVHDRDASFPVENFDQLREAGFLGLTVPEQCGGAGLWWPGRYVEYYELLERLARLDSCTAQLLQVHGHSTGVVALNASPHQAAHYMSEVIDKGALICSAGSEAAPRSKQGESYTSELVEYGQGWRLSCEKYFCSLAPSADYLMLRVAIPGPGTFAERQVFILVPASAPEVEIIDDWDTMGMRSTVSHSVRITDYVVPEDTIIGEPGAWIHNDPRTLTPSPRRPAAPRPVDARWAGALLLAPTALRASERVEQAWTAFRETA